METPPTPEAEAFAAAPIPLERRIKEMKDQQNKLRDDKKRVAKELKVMEKKRSRLKKRARQLSDGDLCEVLAMRKSAKLAVSGSDPATSPVQSRSPSQSSGGASGVAANEQVSA